MCVCVCVCSPFSLSTGAEEPLEKLNSVAGEAKSHGEAGGAKVDRFVNEAAATLLTRRFRPMPLPLRPEPIPGEPPPPLPVPFHCREASLCSPTPALPLASVSQ